jgi:hypothetical protein
MDERRRREATAKSRRRDRLTKTKGEEEEEVVGIDGHLESGLRRAQLICCL